MDIENANCKVKVSQCLDMEVIPIERPLKITREIAGLEILVQELHKVFSNEHVNVQDLQSLMASYKSNPKDWKKYAKFDRFRYTRNLVDAGNGAFNIMILCWGPGHASSIHDHADSHCFMKVLSGSLEEVRYDWPSSIQPEVRKVLNRTKTSCQCSKTNDDEENCKCQNDRCHSLGGNADAKQNAAESVSEFDDEGGYDSEQMKEIGRKSLELNDVCYINDALGLHRVENASHAGGAVSLHVYCPPFAQCRVFDARSGRAATADVTFWSVYGKKTNAITKANEIAESPQ